MNKTSNRKVHTSNKTTPKTQKKKTAKNSAITRKSHTTTHRNITTSVEQQTQGIKSIKKQPQQFVQQVQVSNISTQPQHNTIQQAQQPQFTLQSLATLKNKKSFSFNTLASSYGFDLFNTTRRFNATKPEAPTAAVTEPSTPATPATATAEATTDTTTPTTDATTTATPTEGDAAATTTTTEAAAEPVTPPKPKKMGVIKTLKVMYKKYGKLAFTSYFGVYFGCMALLPALVHAIPSSVFDATELIDWCRVNDHGVWAMDWISGKLDEHPAIGDKVRANPKLAADIGAGLLINELAEPIRIPMSIAVMKYFGDKKIADQEAAGVEKEQGEEEVVAAAAATPVAATDAVPPQQVAAEVKETKQQQTAV